MLLTVFNLSILIGTVCMSLLTSWFVRRYALHTRLLDVPNSRSSHVIPTPRGGGLAIVISFFAAVITLSLSGLLDMRIMSAVSVGAAIALIGFLDDRRHLSARFRLVVHVAAAATVVLILDGTPGGLVNTWGPGGVVVCSLIMVLVLTWATNLFNFMDGIDGLAGSEAIFISLAGAFLNQLNGGNVGLTSAMFCLSSATFGFLHWNWPPARLFMGDVGSGFLGFILALLGLAMSWRGTVPVEVWPILGGVFVVDASVTLIQRMCRGDAWFAAHRMHAYQHLARKWRAHLPVTLVALAINVLWLFPLAFCAASYRRYAIFFLLIALVPLVALALLADAGKPE